MEKLIDTLVKYPVLFFFAILALIWLLWWKWALVEEIIRVRFRLRQPAEKSAPENRTEVGPCRQLLDYCDHQAVLLGDSVVAEDFDSFFRFFWNEVREGRRSGRHLLWDFSRVLDMNSHAVFALQTVIFEAAKNNNIRIKIIESPMAGKGDDPIFDNFFVNIRSKPSKSVQIFKNVVEALNAE
ncbi:MAG: hypothetical protein GY757_09230 [bacterium]|nr:hypothetical protein [bacterium]